MPPKGRKLNAKAAATADKLAPAPLVIADALSKPLVGTPDAAALRASLALIGPDNAADKARQASSETTGTSTETTVEKDSEEDENGSKETTTTTTTESNYSSSEPDEEEEGDGDEEEETEEEATTKAATAPSSSPTRLTSGDVLALVRELTGSAKPAEQLGALRAMSDNAKRAAKAEKGAAAAKRTSKIEAAIREGKLAPAQRAWALGVEAGVLDGYLKTAAPLVKRAATTSAKEAASNGEELGKPSAAAIAVAATMGMDPKALEAHAVELRKSGALH